MIYSSSLVLVHRCAFSLGHVEQSPRKTTIFYRHISIGFLDIDFNLSSVVQSMKPFLVGSQRLAVSVWKIGSLLITVFQMLFSRLFITKAHKRDTRILVRSFQNPVVKVDAMTVLPWAISLPCRKRGKPLVASSSFHYIRPCFYFS